MRIRKRSIAALSSEKPGRFFSNEAAAATAKEKEFLLPLVAAVVDIQAKAKARFEREDCEIAPTARQSIGQIHTRPLHKWRNALHRTRTFDLQAEEEKPVYKANEKELQISKLLQIDHVSPETEDGMSRKKEKVLEDKKKKVLEDRSKKVLEDSNNMHAGSQCRRRNGRGWRCSERTLVGYHLCEHHLGKGRLRSINNSNSTSAVVVKDKGTKFKDLRLIHAAAPPL